MSNRTATLGVCAACKHEPGCIYLDGLDSRILQCEQFELGFRAEADPPAATHSADAPIDETDGGRFAGLCVNCDSRYVCIYPKPEGGVWQCEEYT